MNSTVNDPNRPPRHAISFLVVAPVLAALALALNGCKVLKATANLPVTAVEAVMPGPQSVRIDPASVQTEVLHYADDFIDTTTIAIDEYAHRVKTTEAHSEALRWKLAMNSSVLSIATGPSPVANLIDFVSLATIMRASLEERALHAEPPGAFDGWLDSARILETNAWKMAARVLDTNQQNQLHNAIERTRTQNTSLSDSFLAHPEQLPSLIRERGGKDNQTGGVFSLVGLDPVAGLDPAVREVTRTRLFAERALFASQHLPLLVRCQAELLSDQILHHEEIASMLESVERISKAADSTSKTVAELPDRFTAERKAFIDALDVHEDKLSSLTAEVNRTLDSANNMSVSLNTTLATFDTLMKRFGVGEPSAKPAKTPSRPFNIVDYAHTAEQITAMAQQLDTLVKDTSGTMDAPALNQRIASLNALADQTKADAKSVLNHAFLLMAGLIILTFACATAYRKAWHSPRSEKIQG
jgi:hypothetical protein